MMRLLQCWLLLVGFCSFLTVAAAAAAAAIEEDEILSILQDNNRLLRRTNHRCSTNQEEEVCYLRARLDGSRLDMTTYCPIDSQSYSECTCTAHSGSTECTLCSYCENTGVFIVDCDNVLTRGCTAVDCYGNCLSRKGPSPLYTDRISQDAVAAIVVFATMCCLPCLTAFVCSRLLPANRRNRQQLQQGGGSEGSLPNNISPQDRKELIEKCLLTRKMDEDALQADLEGNLTKSILPIVVTKTVGEQESSTIMKDEESATSCTQASSMEDSSTSDEEEDKVEKNNNDDDENDVEKNSVVENENEQPSLTNVSLDHDNDNDDENSQGGVVDPCQICLEPFKVGDERSWSLVSDCQHSFHKECITTWLERHDDCPSCRAKYLKVNVVTSEE